MELTKEQKKQIKKAAPKIIEQIGYTTEELTKLKENSNSNIVGLAKQFIACYEIMISLLYSDDITGEVKKAINENLKKFTNEEKIRVLLMKLQQSEEPKREIESLIDEIQPVISETVRFVNFTLIQTNILSKQNSFEYLEENSLALLNI